MKHLEPFEHQLIAARHRDEGNSEFVTQVMDTVKAHAINSRAFRTTNEQLKKETFIMKLRKLPVALIMAIVFAAVIGLGGVSYAAVKVIEAMKPVVKESHTNQNGKTQITVAQNACNELQQTRSERYELKEGVDLSAEDAAKYIQAHCHLLVINERLDLRGAGFASGIARGTITQSSNHQISINVGGTLYNIDSDATIYDKDVRQSSQADLKVDDEILAYRDMHTTATDSPIVAIFKPVEALKYYDPAQQQNIRSIKPCANNATMDCVVASSYNAVTLVAARGGSATPQAQDSKELQGRVIDHTNDHFILENNGHQITFQTPYDIVTRYNQTTVYGLAQYNTIYANTDPAALKIAVGDSLSLFYAASAHETTIPWDNLGVVTVMAERVPGNIDVLRKY